MRLAEHNVLRVDARCRSPRNTHNFFRHPSIGVFYNIDKLSISYNVFLFNVYFLNEILRVHWVSKRLNTIMTACSGLPWSPQMIPKCTQASFESQRQFFASMPWVVRSGEPLFTVPRKLMVNLCILRYDGVLRLVGNYSR